MTVPTTVDEVSYTGAGATDTYAYTFRIFQDSDLLVTQTALDGTVSALVLTTDYTVTGALSYSGGTIILTAGNLGSGVGLVITRAPEEVQDTSLQSQGAYDAKTVENALDLLTMICLWLQNQVSRALIVPPGTTPITLPDPAALNLLQWNAAADGLQNLPLADLSPILLSGNFIVDRPAFTAGVTTAVTLTQAPGTTGNTLVAFDGVYQQKNTYSVSGTTLTFDAAIPLGVLSVEVTQSAVLPLAIPADNSVATAALQNGSVTAAKIANGAVQTATIADGNVTLAKLAAGVLQSGKNGIINGAAIQANRVDYVASVSGTYGYGKGDRCKGALTGGGGVTGTLTQVTTSSAGSTGCAFRWSAVDVDGSNKAVKYRFYIEAKDAIRYKNQTASVSASVFTDDIASTYTISVSKANAADNFSAVTLISAGSGQLVTVSTKTPIYSRAIAMGDCSNGIQVDIVATSSGALALYDLADVQFELGATETTIEIPNCATEQARCQRYFQSLVGDSTQVYALGMANSATSLTFFQLLPTQMRIKPTLASSSTAASNFLATDGTTATALTGLSITAASTTPASVVFEGTAAAGLTAFRPYRLAQNAVAAYRIDYEADF